MKKSAIFLVAILTLAMTACDSNDAKIDEAVVENSVAVETPAPPSTPSTPAPPVSTEPADVPDVNAAETLDLLGSWQQVNSNSTEDYLVAYINNGAIEISWHLGSSNLDALYWAGTYEAPNNSEKSHSWESVNDKGRTQSAIMASGDDTKLINYKDGQLSFDVSLQGMTMTVLMEKTSDDAPEIAVSSNTSNNDIYFKDNVLLTSEYKIEITDYKVIPAGSDGNQYGDQPVVAFWYDITNINGGEDLTASTAWIMSFKAIQDNDPNIINELDIGMHPDSTLRDNQFAKIKLGGTVSCAIAYELSDLTTPILLKGYENMFMDPIGEQLFEIANK